MPEPAGEVVVEVVAATACGTDRKMLRHGHPILGDYPARFGHETAGVRADTGERVLVGDSVACGACGPCRAGRAAICRAPTWVLGGFAERIAAPAAALHAIPDGLDFAGAAMAEPLAACVHAVARGTDAADVAVLGGGTIGLMLARLLVIDGRDVLVCDRHPERRAQAQALGARCAEALGEHDLVFEAVGRVEAWEQAGRDARPAGPRCSSAAARAGTVELDTDRLHYEEVDVRGAFHHTRAEVDRALALLAAGEVDWRALAGDVVGPRRPRRCAARADGGRGAQARGGTGAMRLARRALAVALCALAAAPAARAACPPVPPPPPADRPASAAQIDAYVRAVARASPVVRSAVAGFSVQGRPLRYAIASALPTDGLRAAFARLRAVRAGRARSAGDAPAVVWVAGSVHGNEPSGADADLRLLRDLARRCEDPLLRRVAVVVLADQNPDGRELRTRYNAAGFDLNRDWLAAHAARDRRAPARAAGDAAAGLRRPARAGRRPVLLPALLGAALPRAPAGRARGRARRARPRDRRGLRARGLRLDEQRELRPPLPRLRRQRHDAALRGGRDDARGRRRRPVRAARRRAPRRRPRRGARGRPPSRAPCWRRGRSRSRRRRARARAACSSSAPVRACTAMRWAPAPSRSSPG